MDVTRAQKLLLSLSAYLLCSSAAKYAFIWPRDSAATNAVVTLLAHSTAAWITSTLPLVKPPRATAATAARNPTTVACTWGGRAGDNKAASALIYHCQWICLLFTCVSGRRENKWTTYLVLVCVECTGITKAEKMYSNYSTLNEWKR